MAGICASVAYQGLRGDTTGDLLHQHPVGGEPRRQDGTGKPDLRDADPDRGQAQSVIVLKRSMAAGYSGVENELFYHPRTSMLFGDAKSSLQQLISDIKEV
jgi:NAD(P) transhydrogenase beta subunit